MTTLLLVAAVLFATRYGPPMVIWLVAFAWGMMLIRRSRWIGAQLVRARNAAGGFDRRTSRAERRLMRAHLKLAVQQTALASLFPAVMAQARALADS